MPIVVGDRVLETSTTSGTGTLTLLGAATGNQSFVAGVGVGNQTYYTIFDPTANTWEVGFGTLLTGTTLSRTTVFSNSSGTTALISFAANSKNVFCTSPASKFVDQSDVGTLPNQVPLNQYLGKLAFQDVVNTVTNNPYIDTSITAVQPSLSLDFVNAKTLDPRITFTRATTSATVVGTATYYDGETSAVAEQNLLVQSQNFGTTWTNTNIIPAATTAVNAPDGTATAWTLTDDATNAAHNNSQTVTLSAPNVPFTLSVYVQYNTLRYFQIAVVNAGFASQYMSACFDLTLNTFTTATALQSNVSATITQVGSSAWYRCTLTGTYLGANLLNFAIRLGGSNTATAGTFPSYVGTGSSVYVWGAQFEQHSGATIYFPTTTTPFTNYIPQLLTAPQNTPRFDYDPITGVANGLFTEQASTNLLLNTNGIGGTSWTLSTATASLNANIAPDGSLTATKLVESGTTAAQYVSQTVLPPAGILTFSVYAKAAERSSLILATNNANNGAQFNLANGTIGSSNSPSGYTATMTPVGNGWYRCAVQYSSAGGAPAFAIMISNGAAITGWGIPPTGSSYASTAGYGIYVWGAQLEALGFQTSYIPTTTAAVQRVADSATMSGTNFSSWYNINQGTFFSTFNIPRLVTGNPRTLTTNTVSVFSVAAYNGTTSASISTFDGTNTISPNPYFWNTIVSAANSYGATNLNTTTAGGQPTAGVQSVTREYAVSIGLTIGTNHGYIRKVAYYPVQLSNAELQEMTQ